MSCEIPYGRSVSGSQTGVKQCTHNLQDAAGDAHQDDLPNHLRSSTTIC